ncbi:MAG: hypothetical protein HWE13_08145 [Gammaproteobacteria bacterium]|nr:hypothetical protein [Gammaproteobacteria bacterium]NVK88083.1 hypothetical protein [Gammaproteobacteria bacterium]
MQWYSNESGYICLGSKGHFSQFEITTPIKTTEKVQQALAPEDLAYIGSYPEDWSRDSDLQAKVEVLAQKFSQQ